MRRLTTPLVLAMIGLLWPFGSPALAQSPAGYSLTGEAVLMDGVRRQSLRSDSQAITVARIAANAAVAVEAVLSNNQVAESSVEARFERTSSACQRTNCLLAVNADYAYLAPSFGPSLANQPIGAVVSHGEILRSPIPTHHQFALTADGKFYAGQLDWAGSLVATKNLQKLSIQAVNREREADQLVLYTPAFGPTTLTNQHGHELVVVPTTQQKLLLGQTAAVRLVEFRPAMGNSAIPEGGFVLSAHGRAAEELASLWATAGQSEALINLDTSPRALVSVGGSPVVVRDGKVVGHENVRHPRTLVGGTADGELLMVTVDGRQPGHSLGMTLQEAGQLMIELGATNAINLDGGGSTTFVERGAIINRPSDRQVRRDDQLTVVHQPRRGDEVIGSVERPVSNFLVVVPRPEAIHLVTRPLDTSQLQLPAAVWPNRPAELPHQASPVVLSTAEAKPAEPARLPVGPLVAAALAGILAGQCPRLVASAVHSHGKRRHH